MAAGEDCAAAASPGFIAKHAVLSGAVLQVAVGCFRAPGRREVVLGRGVSLELLAQRSDGSLEVTLRALELRIRVGLTRLHTHEQSVLEQPVFDTILDLCLLPWSADADASAHVRRLSACDVVCARSRLLAYVAAAARQRPAARHCRCAATASAAAPCMLFSNAPLPQRRDT